MKRSTVASCLFGIALLLTACSGGGGSGAETAGEDAPEVNEGATNGATAAEGGGSEALTLDLGTPSDTLSSSFYQVVAAEQLGYFADENLTVNIVPGSGSGSLVEQIVAGNVPTGMPSTPAVVEALGSGLELRNWYHVHTGSIFGIWVPEDSDVQSVADLAGKTIGISEPGGGEMAQLNAALESAGIDPITGVTTIPIGTGDAITIDAIESGRVEAYSSSKNDGNALRVAGLELRDITPAEYETFPGRALITTPESLDANREAFIRLGRAISKAVLFCDVRQDACEQFLQEELPEQWLDPNEQGLTQGLASLEEAIRTTHIPAEDERFGEHDPEAWQEFQDVVAAATEDFTAWSVEDFLVDDLLDEINDFDRQAVVAEAEGWSG